MPSLIKRGRTWYSNFPIKRYSATGEVLRKPDGRIDYTRFRHALDTDKELAAEELSKLLRIRRAADNLGLPFNVHFQAIADSAKGGSWQVFSDKWVAKRKLDNKEKTWQHDQRAIRNITETAAELHQPITHLSQVTPKLLEAIRIKWIEDKRRPSAINRAIRAIKRIMRAAAGFGDAKVYDWSVVGRADGEVEHREHFYTVQQLKTMLRRLSFPYRTAVMLGARNGRRPGEIFFLQWSCVDFSNRTIRSVEIPGVWKPKNKKSREPTPMSDDLYAYLKSLRTLSKDSNWVVSWKDGERTDVRSFWVQFTKYLRTIGIDKGSGHTLRHTFASHLVQQGVDLYVVSKLMRHSSIRQTERYAHLRPPDLMSGARRLPPL